MSEKFARKWEARPNQQSFTNKIKEAVRPHGPLKPRLDRAIRRIEAQIQKLDRASERFSQRDKSIFAKIVEAYTQHDMARANILANELAEIRKMEKMIMHAKLALEQIVLRLSTVSDLGDIVTTLTPTVSVLRRVRGGMAMIFPEAERELGEIGDLLNGIIIDAGQTTGSTINFEAANEDAQKILNEAATVAEQRIKEKLPELPAGIPTATAEKSTVETP